MAMKKRETTKVQVTFPNKTLARLDEIADEFGMSRSATNVMLLSQVLTGYDQAKSALKEYVDIVALKALMQKEEGGSEIEELRE
jgi:metal-responsive CopG/Arc/MetJ family transcriptional regulator